VSESAFSTQLAVVGDLATSGGVLTSLFWLLVPPNLNRRGLSPVISACRRLPS
jgi:hypothetical protein